MALKKKINSDKVVPSAKAERVIEAVNKKFGNNTLMHGSCFKRPNFIPTASIGLDVALGGGVPIGRITQFVGHESSAKTTNGLHILRNAQKFFDMSALIVDLEGTIDTDYCFGVFGLNREKTWYSLSSGQEEALQVILTMQKSEDAKIFLLDSIDALMPTRELEAEMDESVPLGMRARMLGNFYRRFNLQNNFLLRNGKEPATLIVLNQVREKFNAYGDPETAPGGKSTQFYCTVNVWLRKGDWITETGKVRVGQVIKFNVKKNKLGVHGKTGEFDFYFDENRVEIPKYSVDCAKEIVIEATVAGLIERAGAWFTYKKDRFQGVDKLTEFLRENPKEIEALRRGVLKSLEKGG